MINSLYKDILDDYLPGFKRISKGNTKILMDHHSVYKAKLGYIFL